MLEMPNTHHPDSHRGLGELHCTVEIQVLSKLGVAGDEYTRADVIATIQGTMTQDGQVIQVWVRDDHFLAGSLRNDGTWAAMLYGIDEAGDDLLHFQVKVIGESRFGTP